MFEPAIKGFFLMGGLIVAIGAQNAFILKQGLKREHVLPLVLFCCVADAAMAALGVFGLSAIIEAKPQLLNILKIFGFCFLTFYGILSFKRALIPGAIELNEDKSKNLLSAFVMLLAFTFLNPHFYLDTVVLVGSLANQYPAPSNWVFWAGGATASVIWFFSLGYGARLLSPIFTKKSAWQKLDFGIGVVMIFLALMLVW